MLSKPPDTASTTGRSPPPKTSTTALSTASTGTSGMCRNIRREADRERESRRAIVPLVPPEPPHYLHRVTTKISRFRSIHLETHGPLGTLWVGLGLCCFYIALVWINTLLGIVLTPLFIVPLTWLQDRVRGKAPARG